MKTQSKNIAATEALTGKRLVAADGTHTVDSTMIVGATRHAVTSGDDIAWQDDDKPWVVQTDNSAITVGARVKSDADGKATLIAPTTVAHLLTVVGIALDANGSVVNTEIRVDHLRK